MTILFSETKIGSITIKNRFVRSATWEGMATEDGKVTKPLLDLMENLARGEVGLIITGHAYVDKLGQASPWQLGVYSDELIEDLKKIPEVVKKYGSKIFLQIAHSGIFSFNPEGNPGIGPSDIEIKSDFRSAKGIAMTKEQIKDVVKKFSQAAKRAKEAGFDGVQIHAAHGYLLSQFLSPFFNKRKDEYGGDIDGRSRLLIEVYDSIRDSVGGEFPVIVKMNCEDFLTPQMEFEEMVYVAEILEQKGIDGVEMSGGTLISKEFIPSRTKKIAKKKGEVYYREHAMEFKKRISLPLILVGGLRRYKICEELVSNKICDMISLSRPLIREPHLVKRWMQGDIKDALCESDNLCFKPALMGEGLYCYLEKKLKNKRDKNMVQNTFKMQNDVIMGRLPMGCDLLKELTTICEKHHISCGKLEGIGALSYATIGYYDQENKKYIWNKINRPMEVLSLKGNISVKDNAIFIHAHIVLGDSRGQVFGGHLGEGSSVFAFEYIIIPFSGKPFERKFHNNTGLFLWDK